MRLKTALAQCLLTGSMLLASQQVWAEGKFYTSCAFQYNEAAECAKLISDLVTDKFTAKFPGRKFQIFGHSDVHTYASGGYVAYAVVGVVPRNSPEFPQENFSTTIFERQGRASKNILSKVEVENFRNAIQSLIDACDDSKTCDIYQPNKR